MIMIMIMMMIIIIINIFLNYGFEIVLSFGSLLYN